jgi:hypothetical protein
MWRQFKAVKKNNQLLVRKSGVSGFRTFLLSILFKAIFLKIEFLLNLRFSQSQKKGH